MHSDPASSTSIQILPNPPSSFQPPPTSFQSPASPLEHPQYLDKNIAGNWTIFPNLDRKINCYPFWLKIGTDGIVEVLTLNPDLDFWSSYPKINFWANLDPKSQSCLFCLKIGPRSISRMHISIPDLEFWNSNPKTHFCTNFGHKS